MATQLFFKKLFFSPINTIKWALHWALKTQPSGQLFMFFRRNWVPTHPIVRKNKKNRRDKIEWAPDCVVGTQLNGHLVIKRNKKQKTKDLFSLRIGYCNLKV